MEVERRELSCPKIHALLMVLALAVAARAGAQVKESLRLSGLPD
jgi:hypothetical protein